MAILHSLSRLVEKMRRKGKSFPKPTIVPRAAHTLSRNQISENALKVLYRLHEAGFSAYLVGGAVRDVLLDEHPKDFDVATDARPEEIRKLFRNCILIGRRFRLAHVRFRNEVIEVATFRTEAKPVANPKNDMIMRDNRYGTVVEDAWRRDFTVNALYYNIADFSVVDFTQGLEDLKHRQLRIIGDPELRYREDPVRMLRAIRFAGKLNFSLNPETEEPIKRLSPLLEWVPAARLFEEFLKLFFHGHGQKTFELLSHYDQFQYLFPSTFKAIQLHIQARSLLELTLKSTDNRIKIDKPVTPAFLLAALLWYPLQEEIDIFHKEGQTRQQAFFLASEKVGKQQNKHVAFPRRFLSGAQDIWLLQSRLERRVKHQITALLASSKFRAAYDFLVLRAQSGEKVQKYADWWTALQAADPDAQAAMIAELPGTKRKKNVRKKAS